MSTIYNKKIAIWLFVCCAAVASMVVLGGVTRLTDSGLSMTAWKPVTGWLPPLNDVQWQEEFNRYKTSPQYNKVNFDMVLHEFRSIFWLEYLHRLLGRVTGLIFLLPLVFFIYKRAVDKRLALKLGGIFALGGTQGVIGWFMVSSGLKDVPNVSQYWLAFHLITAFIIFALIFLLGLSVYNCGSECHDRKHYLRNFSFVVTGVILVQVVLGAFVAGLDAGWVYNTFPLMDGDFVPKGLWLLDPAHRNFFENVTMVQFNHRIFAYIVALTIFGFWLFSRKFKYDCRTGYAIDALLIMVIVQFGIGVLTLLYSVPVALASIHQFGALILFAISLYVNFALFSGRMR